MNSLENNIKYPYLTYKTLGPLFSDQLERKSRHYQNVVIWCALTVSVVVLATCLSVNLVALSAIPMILVTRSWTDKLGNVHEKIVRVPAPGFEGKHLGHVLGVTFGSTWGPPLVALVAGGIGNMIANSKIKHLRTQIQQISEGHDLKQRLQGKALTKALTLADNQTLHALFAKMDLMQLITAEYLLKNSKLKNWCREQSIIGPLAYNQTILQHIFAIFENKKSRATLLNNLVKFDSANKKVVLDVNIRNAFFQLLRKIPDKGTRLLLACKWMQLAAAYADQGITSTLYLSSPSMSSAALKTEINQSLLFQSSSVIKSIQEAEGVDSRKIEIEVEDARILTYVLRMLKNPEDYIDKKFKNDNLKRIFLCMHQYLDQFVDTLQLVFDKSEIKALSNQKIFDTYNTARRASWIMQLA